MRYKNTLKTLFLLVTVALLILPAITTFNEILTTIVMRIYLYRYLQDFIVPIQAKMITVVMHLFGLAAVPTLKGVALGNFHTIGNHVTISWNCIGWQSFILFLISLGTGLQGNYNTVSKMQTITIGILGTFLINIARISIVVLIAQFIGAVPSLIFHDYVSTLMTIAWLFVYWWFSFTYVLENEYS